MYDQFFLRMESAAAEILQLFSEITQEVQLETLQLVSMCYRKDDEKEDGFDALHICEYVGY